ncbi:hypothetical protein TeGR_g13277 [Tetraparma gracilis]|uniref:Aquaporin-like protein n=1 Tax=Tetraparma gracilis TaxID=2962635 RepID=A0ABQ6M588_9STRA|nr:hypothetical protein TeGR_g13277 [Tetraparma gracilis]
MIASDFFLPLSGLSLLLATALSRVYAPCLILALAYPCLSPKLRGAFRSEFLGSIVMVGCTFSAGKWWGLSSQNAEWALHAAGVVAADRASGGPDVNPAVTFSMFALGKLSLDAFLAKVAGQLLGGYVAFPLYAAVATALKLSQFGGPEVAASAHTAAFADELLATFLLLLAIYFLNWEVVFAKRDKNVNYLVKQLATAGAIRALIVNFPAAGPSINPMLATMWWVYKSGGGQSAVLSPVLISVYWIAPMLGSFAATVSYALYSGCTVFGYKVRPGVVSEVAEDVATAASKATKAKAPPVPESSTASKPKPKPKPAKSVKTVKVDDTSPKKASNKTWYNSNPFVKHDRTKAD